MNDSTRAIALSALLALSMAAGAVALTGTTVAETSADAGGGVPAVQANGTDVPQIQAGETMTIRGETSLDPATNNVTIEVTDGPSADTFETVTVDDWGDDGIWSAELFVSEEVEPGTYTAEVTVGGATTTTQFEVVAQQAAQGNETPAAADNETTEDDGILIGGADNETTEAGMAGNETNATAENETVAVNETELAANQTPIDQFQPGQTMIIRGTTSLSAADNTITVAVTEGPSADAFENVTVDDWQEDGNWSAEVSIPEDAEPGNYEALITVGDTTTTTGFEVVEQQAAQANETTTEEDGAVVDDNETETTTEEDGAVVGDNETETTTEEEPAVDGNETETTTEEDGAVVDGNETETTTEEEPAVDDNETAVDDEDPAVDETTTPGQPGFGVAVALAALAVSLLALARRRQ